ncbi:hypothetical protein EUTSA_v10023897mg [Eutrema salsugineum]|uniref:MATH domain-containing protein n=1 Tax=Eutrema salsugineum TaxID=72664 RepID=V4KD27_EUTSA|nr:hypothetical protein EUTSA_v10023897mg [Eutrema salsugineum]
MEDHKPTSFTFEIDNFSDKDSVISSPNFLSGGREWYVRVHPKGDRIDDHLSLYLCVANPESLRFGWKRRASFSILLLNQSGKELYRKDEFSCQLFCAQTSSWGWPNALPLKKLQEKGFLEKNKLILKVQVKVAEVVDEGDVTGNEMLDVNGFQAASVSWIFVEHPDIAINAQNELIELTEAGFKLDWLKIRLDEAFLESKKATDDDGSRVQELEEHIKNLKLELNKEQTKSAAQIFSLEQTVSSLKDELMKKNAKAL